MDKNGTRSDQALAQLWFMNSLMWVTVTTGFGGEAPTIRVGWIKFIFYSETN